VHAIGGGLLLFEVQQNSDVTFRLHDWERVDASGQLRQLHVEQSLAVTDFSCGPTRPVQPVTVGPGCQQLIDGKHFRMWRWQGDQPFKLGQPGQCRIVVGIRGQLQLRAESKSYALGPGKVFLLPAELSGVACQPIGPAELLEVGLPA
jgi:mannose-6-phosphate isomerase